MHLLSPLFYMEAKFRPLEKELKMIDVIRDKIFVKTLLDHERNEEIFEELKVEQVDEKQMRLATIYGKNEQQQDAKNNAEL
jgi:hypothetical protein